MKPVKILLAEDDGDDQQFFLDFLRDREDINILPPQENGEEIMRFLEDQPALPDAIILDQNMPKCNGLQTLSLLKNNDRYSAIPVMIYSTVADENLRKNSVSSGAALVRSKPSSYEGYQKLIDEFLEAIG